MDGATPTPRLLAVILTIVLLSAGCLQPGADESTPPAAADAQILAFHTAIGSGREVRFETTHGDIRLLLYEEMMPRTTARFAELVAAGFYDGTAIHRIAPRFVIQGGDPSGTGLLGSGETIDHERHDALLFGTGSVGLARSVDPDDGDSQWFITLSPQPHLSDAASSTAEVFGTYALYAQVIAGMDTARAISHVMTLPVLDRPLDAPMVQQARLHPPPHDIDLLSLPSTIQPRASLGAHAYDLEHPLHLFAGHSFPLAVHLRPDDDASPPRELNVRFEGHAGEAGAQTRLETQNIVLRPVAGDPWSFANEARLPQEGEWTAQVSLGTDTGATHDVLVSAWHSDYEAFTGDA